MSEQIEVGGTGNYDGFEDLLETYNSVSKRLPKGIGFKRDKKRDNWYLYFQFTVDGKRVVKPTGCEFSDVGFVQALDKAIKLRHALDTITGTTELWEWYDKEILGKNDIINDSITYREIFEQIETKYWSGRNKNTKRKRSRENVSDNATYDRQYEYVFKRFSDWDTTPNWQDIKTVLFTWEQGSKSFQNSYSVLKMIISYCPNADTLLALLGDIDSKQTEFRGKQSISLEAFLKWHATTLANSNTQYEENRKSWLWVASMCVVYGLRPSEIAAALNLTKPYRKDGITIPAINDPNNKELLLVIDDFTSQGISTKTGFRVCKPMSLDPKLLETLQIRRSQLPLVKSLQNSKPESIVKRFAKTFSNNLKSWKCPVTQAYAFRHLSNQLGELNGIPQEIRARSLGHSVAVNEQTYKKRSNFQTSIDLLTKHSKDPLSLSMATQQLDAIGFDLDDPSVKAILKVIYQLE